MTSNFAFHVLKVPDGANAHLHQPFNRHALKNYDKFFSFLKKPVNLTSASAQFLKMKPIHDSFVTGIKPYFINRARSYESTNVPLFDAAVSRWVAGRVKARVRERARALVRARARALAPRPAQARAARPPRATRGWKRDLASEKLQYFTVTYII